MGRMSELILGGEDGSVRHRFSFPWSYNADVAVSPDGRLVAIIRAGAEHKRKFGGSTVTTSSFDFAADVIDVASGKTVCTTPPVRAANSLRVAFHPSGDRLAGTASYDVGPTAGARAEVCLWAIPSGELLKALPDVRGSDFSPDGRWIVASLQVFATDDGKEVFRLPASSFSPVFRPDGKHLAALDRDGLLTVWDTAAWKPLARFAGHPGASLAYSPDGGRLAVGREDGTIRVLRADDAKELRVVRTSLGTTPTGWLRFHPDGNHLFGSAGRYGFPAADLNAKGIDLWPVAAPQDVLVIEKIGQGFYGPTVCFDPAGKWVASATSTWEIKLWDPTTGAVLRTLSGPTDSVLGVAVSPDGRYVAAAANDGAWVWDLRGGGTVRQFKVPKEKLRWPEYWVGRAAFSPDSARVALTFTNGLFVHDLASGKLEYTIDDEAEMWFADAAYSPDGSQILTSRRPGESGSTIQIWDARTGAAVARWEGEHRQVNTIRWFRDGKRFVTCGTDGLVRLWDTTGKVLRIYTGHNRGANGVAIALDEKRIASAGWDGTVKVWDVESGAELLTLTGHRGEVYAVEFSPDGHQLASTGADRTLRVWDATLTPAMRHHEAALARVRALAAEVVLKDEVMRRLREDKALAADFRGVALKLAEDLREDPTKLNEASWVVVSKPGATPDAYALAVRQAKAACQLSPKRGDLLNTLGWAYYRAGSDRLAIDTLTEADKLNVHANKASHPSDLAPLAMAQHRLGLPGAHATLHRLRESMRDPRWAMDEELLGFLREAEALIPSVGP